jgi:hypothetical protein
LVTYTTKGSLVRFIVGKQVFEVHVESWGWAALLLLLLVVTVADVAG